MTTPKTQTSKTVAPKTVAPKGEAGKKVGAKKEAGKASAPKKPSAPKTETAKKDAQPKKDAVPKDGLNALTRSANLSFNVQRFKDLIKNQLKISGVADDGQPNITGAHVALAAANEALCLELLRPIMAQLGKDKSGLFPLSKAAISNAVQLDSDLNSLLYRFLVTFDADTVYTSQYCVDQAVLTAFVEKNQTSTIKLDHSAYNLVAYLLNKFSVLMTKSAHVIMQYGHRKSLNGGSVLAGIKIHCTDQLAHRLAMKVDDALKSSGYTAEATEQVADETGDATVQTVDATPATGTEQPTEAQPVDGEGSDDVENVEAENAEPVVEVHTEAPKVVPKKGGPKSGAPKKPATQSS